MSVQFLYACFFTIVWVALLNSLLNPIVYSVRLRQFRVAFVELTCRTTNIAEAEEIELRVFGSHNAIGQAGQGRERAQKNTEQGNVNNCNIDNMQWNSAST